MSRMPEQEYDKPFDPKVWKTVGPFVRPYIKPLAIAVMFISLSAVVDVALPLFQRYAVDTFIAPRTTVGLGKFTAVYLAVILLQGLLVLGFARQSLFVEMNVGRRLKKAVFEHLQQLSVSFFNNTPVGYLLARLMSDTDRIAVSVTWILVDMFWALLYVVIVFAVMFSLNARLAAVVMVVVPVLAVATVFFQSRILKYNRAVRSTNSILTGALNEGISGAKTSKSLVIEHKNSGEFKQISEKLRSDTVRAVGLNAVYIAITSVLGSVIIAFVAAYGGELTIAQIIEIGTLSTFMSYAVGIFEPIGQLARLSAEVISSQACIERVHDLLGQTPDVIDRPEVEEVYGTVQNPKRENWEPLVGDIEFQNVSFRYGEDQPYILEDFSLKIAAGTTVAVVGETGAGKSTIINLICRFFEPTSGRILIDGRDYRDRSRLWLHENLGYVLQTPHLFSGTIKENILYGNLTATDDMVKDAARAVYADTAAERREEGYDYSVGEGGDRLSTGEKQLISFARAVIADPKILILDEATASVDTQTESLIQKATEKLLKSRTALIIAHRLSTVKNADIILHIEDGKITERGTHTELMAAKGAYYALYKQQFTEASVLDYYRRTEQAETTAD